VPPIRTVLMIFEKLVNPTSATPVRRNKKIVFLKKSTGPRASEETKLNLKFVI